MPEDHHDPEHGLRDAIFWYTLELSLPPEGIRKRFGTEEACRARLAEVRWPAGPVCSRCGSHEVFGLSTRAVYKCRSCKHQFSLTSGTPLHGSRLELPVWFAATERIIRSRSRGPRDYFVPAQNLAALLGIHYVAGWRLKKIILADLAPAGTGLLRDSVCVNDVVLPATIPPQSEKHFNWLFDQIHRITRTLGEPSI